MEGQVITDAELIRAAVEAREMAYAPYSHHMVGAALLGTDGCVYRGCNVENASYSPSSCAERTAFCNAVSCGCRSFTTIAIAAGMEGQPLKVTSPCGMCRQVMREFCNPRTFRVLLAVSPEEYEEWTLEKLLPFSFGPEFLNK